MRVLVAPVLVGDRICRIVSPIDSLLEVEEWVGEWWEPSSVTLTTASQSPPASEHLLRDHGVPPEDRGSFLPSPTDDEIQTLLRGGEPAAPALFAPAITDPPRAPSARSREYPGNARFLRRRAKPNGGSE